MDSRYQRCELQAVRFTPAAALLVVPLVTTCGGGGDASGPPPVQVPTQLTFVGTLPATVNAGTAITPLSVAVQSANGATVAGASATVTLALVANTGTPGATLLGTKTASAVNGIAVFANVSIDKAGTGYQLLATSGSLTADTTGAFAIGPGAPGKLTFLTQPVGAAAGTIMTPAPQVAVQDVFGNLVTTATTNVTLILGTAPGVTATLGGTVLAAASGGIATFPDLSLSKAAAGYTLNANATGLAVGTSNAFSITSGPPVSLAIVQQPTSVTSGLVFTSALVVQLRDAFGNPATSASTPVTVAVTPGTGPAGTVLGGTLTVNPINGLATFGALTLSKAGAGTTLTVTAPAITPVTTAAIAVTPGAFAGLTVVTQPSTATGGDLLPRIQAAAVDAAGNPLPTVDSAFSITLTAGTGTAGAHLIGRNGEYSVHGVVTFDSIVIDSAGTGYTLTISQVSMGSVTTQPFDVAIGPAAGLLFLDTVPNTPYATTLAPVNVAIVDHGGNTVTSSSAPVTIAVDTIIGNHQLAPLGTLTRNAAAGVAHFTDLSLNHSSYISEFVASSPGLRQAWSTGFTVTAGPPVAVSFSTQPTDIASRIEFPLSVAIVDAAGETAVTSQASITMRIDPASGTAGASLFGSQTVPTVHGTARFPDLSVDRAGSAYTLVATATALAPDTSVAFSVVPGAPLAAAILTHQSSLRAGDPPVTPLVAGIVDAGGNIVTSSTAPITVTVEVTPGVLRGTSTRNAVGGVATFADLTVTTVGAYNYAVTSPGLSWSESLQFTVTPGLPGVLNLNGQPASTIAGVPLTPLRVEIRDTLGNLASTATNPVTVGILSGTGSSGASLGGTTTRAAVAGVASFPDVSIAQAGTAFRLTASAAGLAGATTLPFDITAPVLTLGAWVGAGQTGLVGYATNVRPAVRILDGATPVPGIPVTFAVSNGGGSVTGPVTIMTNSQGIAQVGGWVLGTPGQNTLTATAAGTTYAGGNNIVSFDATGATKQFSIEVRSFGHVFTPQVQAAFDTVIQIWQTALYADQPDQPVNDPDACGSHVALNETIDDILILATVDSIDGPGGILGAAGSCGVRANGLPAYGIIILDVADQNSYTGSGVPAVILHEIGHVLGFSPTIWNLAPRHCVNFPSSTGTNGQVISFDTHFSCSQPGATQHAAEAFDSIGGTSYTRGNKVPLENCAGIPGCGQGTYNSHWREVTFGDELMTGYIGQANPLSILTIGAFEDIGYTVNYAAADRYAHTFTTAGVSRGSRVPLGNDQLPITIRVLDRSGNVIRTLPPH